MTMHIRTGHRIVREEDGQDGPLRFVIATEGRKADGIDLRMDRLDLERYLANPVIQPSHNYRANPIGRGENVEVDGPRLLADAVFDLDDPAGAEVDRKYRGRFMNAVSVGFDLHGVDDETGIPDRWELLEFSSVSIPLDADAVLESERIARAFALADELREGKVLSGKNKKLVSEALAALQSLLDAAADETKSHDDPGGRTPALSSIDLRRRRLALLG